MDLSSASSSEPSDPTFDSDNSSLITTSAPTSPTNTEQNDETFPLAEKLAMQEKIDQLEEELDKRIALDLREERVWERVSALEVQNEKLLKERRKVLELVYNKRELKEENARLSGRLEREKKKNKELRQQLQKREGSSPLDPQFAEYDESSPSPDKEYSFRSTSQDSHEQEAVPKVSKHLSTSGSHKTSSKTEEKKQKTCPLLSDDSDKCPEQEESQIPKASCIPSIYGGFKRQANSEAPKNVTGLSGTRSKAEEKKEPEIPIVSKYPSTSGPYKKPGRAGAFGNVARSSKTGSKISENLQEALRRRQLPEEPRPKIPKTSKHSSTSASRKRQASVLDACASDHSEDDYRPAIPKRLKLHKPKAEDNKKTEMIKKEAKQNEEEKENQEPKKEVKIEPQAPEDPELGARSDPNVIDIKDETKLKSERNLYRLMKKLQTKCTVAQCEPTSRKRARTYVNYAEEED